MQFRVADYGMLLVLLGLCVIFSLLTVTTQRPEGAAAAQQVAQELTRMGVKEADRILVAVQDRRSDAEFSAELERLGVAAHWQLTIVRGEASAARKQLVAFNAEGDPLAAIAVTETTAKWLLWDALEQDFPRLGSPPRVQPREYRWPNFLKTSNLLNIANQIAVIAIIAIGMTMVIITGGIDLSVGSLIALSAVVCCLFIERVAGGLNASVLGMVAGSLLAIGLCGLVGGMNGFLVTGFQVPPFIVTLSTMLIASGVASLLTGGESVYQIPASFVWLGRGADLFGLPNAVVLMLILYGLAHLWMSRTVPGRYLYAVGGNAQAARLSGVPVRRVVMSAYIVSGALAGLGGVLMSSQLKSASPTYGQMYELYVIAAVVVGGTSLSGGAGQMLGTLVGALIIAVIQNGMNLLNVESYTQKVVLGLVILGAVLLDRLKKSTGHGSH